MQDLTTGSLTRHLLKTTGFMLVTMVFQTLYFLIDLYWVGQLGKEAVAGVGIAGNLNFVTLAVTQMLSVGITTLVSHATGQKDRDRACLIFNQSQVLSMIVGVLFFVVGMATRSLYVNALGPDAVTARLAADYLLYFIPAMALQFAIVAMGAALRGTGNFRPGMIVSTASVILNMVLAPFLIFGWVTHRPYGVAGAAISTLIAVVVATIWLTFYFLPADSYLKFVRADWKPNFTLWKKMLGIGLPAGAEFLLLAVYLFIVYIVSRPFGAAAQAGFGIGMRIVQAGFMPVVALGFSVAPVAGQNFGARQPARVRATFRAAALMAIADMLLLTVICQLEAAPLIRVFSKDSQVIDVGVEYLRIVSWTFPASGVIFVGGSMFQALGHTLPALIASFARIVLVGIPAFILAQVPGFQLHWIWYLSVTALIVQLAVNQLLLFREFGRRLTFAPASVA
ncbi:MAG TPA: MATE family efflux transporter [Vicinamibacterales bacterium]|jgi:MATE family, multidrug efflux pump|nr:MATE family efflux transporter [Vicinamibacterales bacterium]